MVDYPARFSLGHTVMTRNAHSRLTAQDVFWALARHQRADWGDVCREDWKANDHALDEGERLLSAYYAEDGTRFWIITEHDRSVTTVLLPEDY